MRPRRAEAGEQAQPRPSQASPASKYSLSSFSIKFLVIFEAALYDETRFLFLCSCMPQACLLLAPGCERSKRRTVLQPVCTHAHHQLGFMEMWWNIRTFLLYCAHQKRAHRMSAPCFRLLHCWCLAHAYCKVEKSLDALLKVEILFPCALSIARPMPFRRHRPKRAKQKQHKMTAQRQSKSC